MTERETTTEPLFRQNTIAVLWDFDKTLTRGYMQAPIFRHYDIDNETFWSEVRRLPEIYRTRGQQVSPEIIYLNHLLSYVQHGRFQGLSNGVLRELGAQIEFFPGLPDFFDEVKRAIASREEYAALEIHVEHYIVSTGLRQMILGSAVAPFVEGVWGCEFLESPPPPGLPDASEPDLFSPRGSKVPEIKQIGVMLDNTSKTRAVFEINKGVNKNPDIDVNAKMAQADRRVPIAHMICIADGPSDIPMFSVVSQFGGETIAVYDANSQEAFEQADRLARQKRVSAFGPADYRQGSHTARWIMASVERIAARILQRQSLLFNERVEPPPRHLDD